MTSRLPRDAALSWACRIERAPDESMNSRPPRSRQSSSPCPSSAPSTAPPRPKQSQRPIRRSRRGCASIPTGREWSSAGSQPQRVLVSLPRGDIRIARELALPMGPAACLTDGANLCGPQTEGKGCKRPGTGQVLTFWPRAGTQDASSLGQGPLTTLPRARPKRRPRRPVRPGPAPRHGRTGRRDARRRRARTARRTGPLHPATRETGDGRRH